jgi:hypothetical protein
MEWVSTEDVIISLTMLTASGLLVLGTLKLVWSSPAEPVRSSAREPSPGHRVAPPPEDRLVTALRLGRMLLDRALQDPDPTSERKRRLIYRAIACLNRGVEAAPDDESLREALSAAHAALWTTYQQMGLERLARVMPWRATA